MLTIKRRVDIKNEVDSRGGKVRHARVVVDSGINGIDSDTMLAMVKSESTCWCLMPGRGRHPVHKRRHHREGQNCRFSQHLQNLQVDTEINANSKKLHTSTPFIQNYWISMSSLDSVLWHPSSN
jgi:hypothetical protein